MRKHYLLIIVFALLAVTAAPARASSTMTQTSSTFRGQTVEATFFLSSTDANGCTFQTRIDLTAGKNVTRSSGALTTVQSGAVVFVNEDQLCPADPNVPDAPPPQTLHGNGSVPLTATQLSIDSDLTSATLRRVVVPIVDIETNSPMFTLQLNLIWRGVGALTRTFSSTATPPPCEIRQFSVDRQRNARSLGGISVDGAPLAQVVSADAHIMALRQGLVIKGC